MREFSTNNIYEEAIQTPLAPMTLRVGITGHRPGKLTTTDIDALKKAISTVYDQITTTLHSVFQESKNLGFYNTKVPPVLRIISSLAEGADRICIENDIVGHPFELACIIPFTKETYEQDFIVGESQENPVAGTVTSYNELLRKAGYGTDQSRVLELALDYEQKNDAYRTCGEYLVKHSDLIIAMFDGEHNDLGGTSSVIKLAENTSVPVIVISTKKPDSPVIFLEESSGATASEQTFSELSLLTCLRKKLLFSELFDQIQEESKTAIKQRFSQHAAETGFAFSTDIAPDFNCHGPIELNTPKGRFIPPAFTWTKSLFASKSSVSRQIERWKLNKHGNPSGDYSEDGNRFRGNSSHKFYAAFLRADRLATSFAAIHRDIYVSIYIFGAFALLTAAFALFGYAMHESISGTTNDTIQLACVLAELIFLLSILALYLSDHRNMYHQRWLEYRSLAEVLRSQTYLSMTGSNIRVKELQKVEDIVEMDSIGIGGPGRSWVYPYTETLIRWAGFNGDCMSTAQVQSVGELVRNQWLKEQQAYHIKNAATMQTMEEGLSSIGYWSFWATMLVVLLKLALKLSHVSFGHIQLYLAYLATALPVLSTTTFAIRNHAEFEISAQRSHVMRIFFRQKIDHFADQAGNDSLKDTTKDLEEICAASINETSQWVEIYEVKDSETA
ncbi:MAG: hypothetical protein V7744_20800 [Pseudomonadales bacterium]